MSERKAGDALAQYHKDRSNKARNSIIATLRMIEAEIVERGYYCDPDDPDKPRRLSLEEVQRRAGVSTAYLRNSRHADLREIVQDWLHVQKERFATAKPDAAEARRDTIRFYEKALAEVAAEALHWRATKAAQEKRIADLEAQIEAMSDNGDRIVSLGSKRQK
ncbi:MAG: hypothetical protein NXI18_08980 [Alphaproteobacteria bacterium]|nr:hypothetical protein [Alphaproteobacteria bacterium]